jgi:hypothetical protein
VTSIRSNPPPPVLPTATPKASEPGRLAAQKAFFALAAGQPAAAAPAVRASAPPAPTAAAPVARAVARAPAPSVSADQPARPLRPGSLLDIRV